MASKPLSTCQEGTLSPKFRPLVPIWAILRLLLNFLTDLAHLVVVETLDRDQPLEHALSDKDVRHLGRLKAVNLWRKSVESPNELPIAKLVWRGHHWLARHKRSTGHYLVAHVLKRIKNGDRVRGKFHSSILLVPHVWTGAAFFAQDSELIKRESIHQTASWHERLSHQQVGHAATGGEGFHPSCS